MRGVKSARRGWTLPKSARQDGPRDELEICKLCPHNKEFENPRGFLALFNSVSGGKIVVPVV